MHIDCAGTGNLSLEYVIGDNNMFTGRLNLAELHDNIEYLWLYSNDFTSATLSMDEFNSSSLKHLILSNNKINGTIDLTSMTTSLPDIEVFYVDNNYLQNEDALDFTEISNNTSLRIDDYVSCDTQIYCDDDPDFNCSHTRSLVECKGPADCAGTCSCEHSSNCSIAYLDEEPGVDWTDNYTIDYHAIFRDIDVVEGDQNMDDEWLLLMINISHLIPIYTTVSPTQYTTTEEVTPPTRPTEKPTKHPLEEAFGSQAVAYVVIIGGFMLLILLIYCIVRGIKHHRAGGTFGYCFKNPFTKCCSSCSCRCKVGKKGDTGTTAGGATKTGAGQAAKDYDALAGASPRGSGSNIGGAFGGSATDLVADTDDTDKQEEEAGAGSGSAADVGSPTGSTGSVASRFLTMRPIQKNNTMNAISEDEEQDDQAPAASPPPSQSPNMGGLSQQQQQFMQMMMQNKYNMMMMNQMSPQQQMMAMQQMMMKMNSNGFQQMVQNPQQYMQQLARQQMQNHPSMMNMNSGQPDYQRIWQQQMMNQQSMMNMGSMMNFNQNQNNNQVQQPDMQQMQLMQQIMQQQMRNNPSMMNMNMNPYGANPQQAAMQQMMQQQSMMNMQQQQQQHNMQQQQIQSMNSNQSMPVNNQIVNNNNAATMNGNKNEGGHANKTETLGEFPEIPAGQLGGVANKPQRGGTMNNLPGLPGGADADGDGDYSDTEETDDGDGNAEMYGNYVSPGGDIEMQQQQQQNQQFSMAPFD